MHTGDTMNSVPMSDSAPVAPCDTYWKPPVRESALFRASPRLSAHR